jgi:molybdenum cofactor biosynthesis enzyme MoaA
MAALNGESRAVFHLVVPADGEPASTASTRRFVYALRLQAQGHVGGFVHIMAADAARRRLWCGETGQSIEAGGLATHLSRCTPSWRSLSMRARLTWLTFGSTGPGSARVCVVMNAGFLLAVPPPLAELIERAEREPTWCAARSTKDAYAFAFTPRMLPADDLWPALRLLTAGADDPCEAEWTRLVSGPPLAPAASFVENSPALAGIPDARSRRAFDSPLFVNTAIREMMTGPQDRGRIAGDPTRMAAALAAQRGVSRVPWVFNTLLNDIEYRLGRVEPESVPPEVHLSVTGLCNIECRFCAYEHDNARADFVDVASVARLDFLRFVQTFRLHSGLGEPTANRHLPRIIEHVAGRFPHVGMNFFTNAVTLDRPGLGEALVGNVRWINASLNAGTRESWKDQCKVDLFDRVARSLRALHRAKREQRSLLPLVFGSMVLTRANLSDLPRMPALCRELGVDRFTAFPYFGLGYHGRDKYGPEMTLEAGRREYDELYWRTVREAEAHEISLEIPLPGAAKRAAFGVEARPPPRLRASGVERVEARPVRVPSGLHRAARSVLSRPVAVGRNRQHPQRQRCQGRDAFPLSLHRSAIQPRPVEADGFSLSRRRGLPAVMAEPRLHTATSGAARAGCQQGLRRVSKHRYTRPSTLSSATADRVRLRPRALRGARAPTGPRGGIRGAAARGTGRNRPRARPGRARRARRGSRRA